MILSICIPTYNRGNYLKKTIPLLLDEIENNGAREVEICISDNASTDGTEDIVYRLSKDTYVPIIYKKKKENKGAPRNFLSATDLANGKYIWLMGSDDWIVPGKLATILSLCKEQRDDILLGDRINVIDIGQHLNTEFWSSKSSNVIYKNLAEYIDKSDSIGCVFSFLSDIIVKKSRWMEAVETKYFQHFVESPYVHTYILFEIIRAGGVLNYLHSPIVYSQIDNDSFLKGKYFNRIKIDYQYLEITKTVFGGDSAEEKAIKELLKRERRLFHFMKAKYMSQSRQERIEIYEFMRVHQISCASLIQIIPKYIIWLMLGLYKIINYRRYFS